MIRQFFRWLETNRTAALALGIALVLGGLALWFLADGAIRWLGLVLIFFGVMIAPRFGESRKQ